MQLMVLVRGEVEEAVLVLARGLKGRAMRVVASRIKARVSWSMLVGRGGRGGGGPLGLVKGTVAGCLGRGEWGGCWRAIGREMEMVRPLEVVMKEEREPRGVGTGAGMGRGSSGSVGVGETEIWGDSGRGGDCDP